MFWFHSIRFGAKYFLKMNISDLRPCSQSAGNAVSETQNSKLFREGHTSRPPYKYKCVVTYFAPPAPPPPPKKKSGTTDDGEYTCNFIL